MQRVQRHMVRGLSWIGSGRNLYATKHQHKEEVMSGT